MTAAARLEGLGRGAVAVEVAGKPKAKLVPYRPLPPELQKYFD
jgi:hypothetical protein